MYKNSCSGPQGCYYKRESTVFKKKPSWSRLDADLLPLLEVRRQRRPACCRPRSGSRRRRRRRRRTPPPGSWRRRSAPRRKVPGSPGDVAEGMSGGASRPEGDCSFRAHHVSLCHFYHFFFCFAPDVRTVELRYNNIFGDPPKYCYSKNIVIAKYIT